MDLDVWCERLLWVCLLVFSNLFLYRVMLKCEGKEAIDRMLEHDGVVIRELAELVNASRESSVDSIQLAEWFTDRLSDTASGNNRLSRREVDDGLIPSDRMP